MNQAAPTTTPSAAGPALLMNFGELSPLPPIMCALIPSFGAPARRSLSLRGSSAPTTTTIRFLRADLGELRFEIDVAFVEGLDVDDLDAVFLERGAEDVVVGLGERVVVAVDDRRSLYFPKLHDACDRLGHDLSFGQGVAEDAGPHRGDAVGGVRRGQDRQVGLHRERIGLVRFGRERRSDQERRPVAGKALHQVDDLARVAGRVLHVEREVGAAGVDAAGFEVFGDEVEGVLLRRSVDAGRTCDVGDHADLDALAGGRTVCSERDGDARREEKRRGDGGLNAHQFLRFSKSIFD